MKPNEHENREKNDKRDHRPAALSIYGSAAQALHNSAGVGGKRIRNLLLIGNC